MTDDWKRQFEYTAGQLDRAQAERDKYKESIDRLAMPLKAALQERDEYKEGLRVLRAQLDDAYAKLQAEKVDHARSEWLVKDRDYHLDRLTKARAALRAVEWNGNEWPDWCAYCHQYRSQGHVPECIVAEALRETT